MKITLAMKRTRVHNGSMTVREAADYLLDGMTYDTALPISWVETFRQQTGVDPYGLFVWAYPPKSLGGEPFALTNKAAELLKKLVDPYRRVLS